MRAIEFRDYIFDRYVFLGFDPTRDPDTISPDEIKSAIKTKKAHNHPDRLTQVDPQLQSQAQHTWNLTLKCEEALLDDAIRVKYNKELKRFRTDCPELVSTNGAPIISLGDRGRVDVDALLSDTPPQSIDFAGILADLVNYKPATLERARKLYKSDPQNPDFLAMYREALAMDLQIHDSIEKDLWESAGIYGNKIRTGQTVLMDPQTLPESVAARIEYVKTEIIPTFVQEHAQLAALGYDKNPLLLLASDHKPQATNLPATQLAEAQTNIAKAQQRFAELSQRIQATAERKAKIIAELLDLSAFEMAHKENSEIIDVYVMIPDNESDLSLANSKGAVLVHNQTRDGNIVPEMIVENVLHQPYADLRSRPFTNTTLFIVHNPALGELTLTIGHGIKMAMWEFDLTPEIDGKRTENQRTEPSPHPEGIARIQARENLKAQLG